MAFRTALLTLLVAFPVVAQQQHASANTTPTVLVATSSRLLDMPRFSGFGVPLCDDKGDTFFHVPITSRSVNESSVLEVPSDSSDAVWFRLSSDLASKTAFHYFSVTPSGKVWFLDETKDGPLAVFGFDSDAQLESQVSLDTPLHFWPDDFAVAENGIIFLAGHFGIDASRVQQGKRFAGIFAKSGKLLTEVKLADLENLDLKRPLFGNGGSVAVGIDGNFYFLRPDKIDVLSQSGELTRTIPFQMPSPDVFTSDLRLSGGLVSIDLPKSMQKPGVVHHEFLVLDAFTGGSFGLYLPPEDVGAPLCFSRTSGFTFLSVDNDTGKFKFVTAPMR